MFFFTNYYVTLLNILGYLVGPDRSYYKMFRSEKLSWSDARANCVYNGGDLATIKDYPEKAFVKKSFPGETFWLGGSDIANENDWKWVDGTQVDRHIFDGHEPNNVGGEDCMAAYRHVGVADHACSSPFNFLCEFGPKCSILH